MAVTDVRRALAATASLAPQLGVTVDEMIVLHSSNRITVRLAPHDVVARVAPATDRNRTVAAFEVEIARNLNAANSVVGRLAPGIDPAVHLRNEFAVTFWEYYQPTTGDIDPAAYARALDAVHSELRGIEVRAPHVIDRVDEARSIVDDRSQSPALSDADRELLSETLLTRRRTITDRRSGDQLIHGEPHPGNLVASESGIRFVDLQTCCYGPVEFDIAHAPDEVAAHYSLIDPGLLDGSRILMRAMVAAWRADRDDHFPDGHQRLDQLLAEIRTTRGEA